MPLIFGEKAEKNITLIRIRLIGGFMHRNNAKKWAAISLWIAIGGVCMMIAGIAMDSMDTMWLIMVGLMLALTFFICFGIFRAQAKNLERMFSGEALLVHFTYDQQEADKRKESETTMRKKSNWALILIITAFFVVITLLFLIFGFDDAEEAGFFALTMAVVLGIVGIAALAAPGAWKRQADRSADEAFIGVKGAWVFGEYMVWDAPLCKLTEIRMAKDELEKPIIEITYTRMQRYGW